MTTAYDMKLTKNVRYLRSQSAVEVVAVLVWLRNVHYSSKGFFQDCLHRQVRLARWSRTENKNTLLVDILLTHIICTVCQCHQHSNFHHFTEMHLLQDSYSPF